LYIKEDIIKNVLDEDYPDSLLLYSTAQPPPRGKIVITRSVSQNKLFLAPAVILILFLVGRICVEAEGIDALLLCCSSEQN